METQEIIDSRSPLLGLPEVVASKILGYLSWQEKLLFVETVPQWNTFLLTPSAWNYFHTDYECVLSRKHLREVHEKVCEIVTLYGKFLQHLEITLQYLDLSDLGFSLLELVSRHCSNLKTLCLYHPACFTLPVAEQFERYIELLRSLVHGTHRSNGRLKYLRLYNLDYLAVDKKSGITELFECYHEEGISPAVTELEFRSV